MTIWFTSDLHLSHLKILEYCNRPWSNLEEMNAGLIANYNETVDPDDTCYILGDFSLNKKWAKEFLPMMNGTKHLILGNHDAAYFKPKLVDYYLEAGFSTVKWEDTIVLAGQDVLLSHFPYQNTNDVDQRYQELRPIDSGGWILHGHCHGRYRVKGKQIDVGVDAWDYKPININCIAALMRVHENGVNIENPHYNHPNQVYNE